MAHIGKYTRAATGHMCKHYERAEGVKFGNIEIDKSRTYLNYNLAPNHNQIKFIQQRLTEVKCLNRKDVNVMCDWVVTIPKELLYLYPEKQKDFFKETYNFLEQKYGKKNVISAYVHLDETTPHMHFAFIPIYHDEKKDIDKVSAYKLFNKTSLQQFHPELSKYLTNKLGVECYILNGATVNGNKTITELKNQSIMEDNKELNKKYEYYINKISENKIQYDNQLKEVFNLKNEIYKLKHTKNALNIDIEELTNKKKIWRIIFPYQHS